MHSKRSSSNNLHHRENANRDHQGKTKKRSWQPSSLHRHKADLCALFRFHSAGACSGLYTLPKSEYSTAAVEIKATEGVNAVLVEGKLHNDLTRDGTRGTSSDGIQRHKVRAVERTLNDTGSRRAQDHDSHSVEPIG